MRKTIAIITTVALVFAMSVTSFADEFKYTDEGGSYSYDLFASNSNIQDGQQYIILVLKKGASTTGLSADSIMYIDQVAASGNTVSLTDIIPMCYGEHNVYVAGAGLSVPLNVGTLQGTPGVTVKGQIKSYDPKKDITVKLMQGGSAVYQTVVPGKASGSGQTTVDFNIDSVVAGIYDLVVSKDAHLTYTIKNVVVDAGEVDLTKMTGKAYQCIDMLAGDIDGDGNINVNDLVTVWNESNYNKSISNAVNKLTDVDGDGSVNVNDLVTVWNDKNYNKGEKNCTYSY